ncbi:VTT domain-containing protein [Brevibacterium sp. 50QC2O2]|uniref:DedA family protein n=1 Tax=Brevibacterium sp. 50QC2O2 TaxID=2968459 RepID=UPI00211C58E5|nr:VTT domain-containing protein [Brevibacterium sp. 50QC2O2]MCQ9387052.1 VTT domain-containing protein [Brevibacterium sp. 50QC2O2]
MLKRMRDPDHPEPTDPDDTTGSGASEPGTTEPQVPSLRDILPWEGKARTGDKVLLGFLIGIPIFYLIMWPLRPMLIAKIPVVFSMVTGAKTVIAGAGAFAAVEGFPLWLVIGAGLIGMMKFDWLWWYAGRRWGDRVVNMFAQDEKSRKRFHRLKRLPRWVLLTLVFFGRWPGVPGTITWLVTGWSRVSFALFFTMNLLGNLLLAVLVAVIGYEIGQPAVDFLKLVDKYAIWISLAIIVGVTLWSARGTLKSEGSDDPKTARPDAGPPDSPQQDT